MIILFHLLNNVLWLKKDTSLPNIDNSLHLTQTLISYFHLKNSNFHLLNKISTYYPPLYPLISASSYFLWGIGEDTVLWTNLLFFSLIIIFTFLIGRAIKDEVSGLLSAFLVSCYPAVFLLSRQYYIDIALILWVVMFIYLLLIYETKSPFNSRRIISALLGITFGLGMLTKWTFIFFVIIPTAGIFLKRENLNKGNFFNFLIFLFFCFPISSLWYLPNAVPLFRNVQLGNLLDAGQDPTIFEINFYLYYLKCLFNYQLYPVFAILFFIGFIFFIFQKKKSGEKILFSHILSSYLLLTFIFNKDLRFSLPYLPAVSVITAIFLRSINSKVVVSFLVLFSLLQFFIFSYQKYPPQKMEKKEITNTVNFIKNDILEKNKKGAFILIASDNSLFNLWTFKYHFFLEFLDYLDKVYVEMDGISDNLSRYDYAVIKYSSPQEIVIPSSFKVIKSFTFQKDKFYLIAKQ